MKQRFNQAASPFLRENSKESRTVRGVYIAVMLLLFGGTLLSAITGFIPGA